MDDEAQLSNQQDSVMAAREDNEREWDEDEPRSIRDGVENYQMIVSNLELALQDFVEDMKVVDHDCKMDRDSGCLGCLHIDEAETKIGELLKIIKKI